MFFTDKLPSKGAELTAIIGCLFGKSHHLSEGERDCQGGKKKEKDREQRRKYKGRPPRGMALVK